MAFADLPVAKDQRVRLLDDAEVALKELRARKPTGAGEIATVSTAQAGSGDGATHYFLDRASLYQVTDCSSQPPA